MMFSTMMMLFHDLHRNCFLTLPLGTIVRLLGQLDGDAHRELGSLTNLYEGVKNLQPKYFENVDCKTMLLYPKNASEDECSKLKLTLDDAEPTKYFICQDSKCDRRNLSTCSNQRCDCGKFLNRRVFLGCPNQNASGATAGVFVCEMTDVIITDNLHVMPNFPCLSFSLLKDLGVADASVLKEMFVSVGFKEILGLLRLSFMSRTPLTDLFLRKDNEFANKVVNELCTSTLSQLAEETSSNSKNINLKLLVHKSSNKVLLAETQMDFVELLFSFLLFPLGSIVALLRNSFGTGALDHLFESISRLEIGKCMKSQELKDRLICPELAPQCICNNQILPQATSQLFFSTGYDSLGFYSEYLTFSQEKDVDKVGKLSMIPKLPKIEGRFLKCDSVFRVTDDLHVRPCQSGSIVSIFKDLEISFSDVEERVVSIGLEEALGILKASLNSKAALTNGLKGYFLKNRKQELLRSLGFLY